MKLHTQRDTLHATLAGVAYALADLDSRISRKISQPYGDGSRSNMVNATTDVLPALRSLVMTIGDVLDETRRV